MNNPLFFRVGIFATLFILLSGLSGSWLISTNALLFTHGFWIYGSMGKSALFGVALLVLLLRNRWQSINAPALTPWTAWGAVASTACLLPFFYGANQLLVTPLQDPAILWWRLLTHASLWAGVLLALGAAYPPRWLWQQIKLLRSELGIAAAGAVGFWLAIEWLFDYWPYLSAIVLKAVVFLLSFRHPEVRVLEPFGIQFTQFSITIGQYCSGIESLLLLSGLYAAIGVIDRDRLIVWKYGLVYFILLAGMMVVNIMRVYIIVEAAFLVSPQMAAKFFHTYAGMVLFLIYFMIALVTLYPHCLRSSHQVGKGNKL